MVQLLLPLKANRLLENGCRSLPGNLPGCIILDSWVFENFILADEPFAKVLGILETCVSVYNNLFGKFVVSLESQILLHERFKATWVPFFIRELWIWQFYI